MGMWLPLCMLCLTAVVLSYRIDIQLNIDIPGAASCSSLTVNSEGKDNKPRDCVEARQYNSTSGVVTIYPADNTPLQVYCDHHTDGGGWLVFQRRQDGSVDFYRNWTSYQNGFGDVTGDFWLGLDTLHSLTSGREYELRVDLMKFDGTKGYATYSNFSISDSSDNYRLHLRNFTGGSAGDSLSYHKDQQFSTYDADHDVHVNSNTHCAVINRGGWWYRACEYCDLNAQYYTSRITSSWGIHWNAFDGGYTLQFAEMKFRPV